MFKAPFNRYNKRPKWHWKYLIEKQLQDKDKTWTKNIDLKRPQYLKCKNYGIPRYFSERSFKSAV